MTHIPPIPHGISTKLAQKNRWEDQATLEALGVAAQAGEESGVAEEGVFARVQDYLGQLAATKANVG